MRIRNLLAAAWRDLGSNQLRHFLVGISMLLGVVAIAAVASADQLVVNYLIAEQEQLHGRAQTHVSAIEQGALEQQDIVEVHQLLQRAASKADGNAVFVARTAISVADFPGQSFERIWYQGDYSESYRMPLSSGQWPRDIGTISVGVVLNEQAADILGVTKTPQSIELDDKRGKRQFVVTGIVRDGIDNQESRIYQSLGTADDSALLREEAVSLLITAPADKQLGLQRFAANTVTDSSTSPIGSLEFMRQDTVDNTKKSVAMTTAAFLGAGILILLVSAVGVLNVGLATVGERSEELVIRRALGATKKQIFGLVVSSSLLIGLIVALVSAGIVVLAATFVIPSFMDPGNLVETIDVPLSSLWFGLLAALVTSFLGALSPALKATRLDVAQALRV